ncbi:HAMP domain-containing protein [Lacibacter luteus]|uniref:histidine kinase n=1 Tax=Lacibacter luteus TaxID=2508719 RepID=A0A4Q1CF20_9BACT|nr:ATP-binding protein [Lacibacter luteus]RXK58421.1 HAMP domain-containing protein [Lacibacter luteus]
MNHILTIRRFVYRNGYLLILAGWLLTFSYLFQYYWSYTSAPEQVKKTLQKAINKREKDFARLLTDSSLLLKLKTGKADLETVEKLVEKDYFIFVASDGDDGFQTRFWNTQAILPTYQLWQRADGIWFEQLINGYYTVYKKTKKLGDGSICQAMALIPVKWNFFVEADYISNDFAYLRGIEKYYNLSDVEQSQLKVQSTDGTILFWLKELNNLPQPLNSTTIIFRLLAMLCLFMFLHKLSAMLTELYSFAAGLSFLIAVILLLRISSYYLPIPFNLRQFELFDPSVYGSNKILRSLGDLLINSFLLLWILLFIRRYAKLARKIPLKLKANAGLIISTLLLFGTTILFGNIIKSLVSDSQISFDVINIFKLSIFSFAGFFVLGSLALNYFIIADWLSGYLKHYSHRRIPLQLLTLTVAGLIYLTFNINSSSVIYQLCLLGWLLLLVMLLNNKRMRLNFLSSNGKTIFWLFFFSLSLTLLLISENGEREWKDRIRTAEKLSLQTDPSSESLLNIAMRNFRSEFLQSEFRRFFVSGDNQLLKDSLISENFSGYLNVYETEIYTFDKDENPLFNIDSVSFNTLNTVYNLQSRRTSSAEWKYYEESFDKFYYIARKVITDTAESGQPKGYVFVISRPKRYADEKFNADIFYRSDTKVPDNTVSYAYAIYKSNELISSVNDYPFPIHLDKKATGEKAERKVIKKGYSELWYNASNNFTIIIAKSQNRLLETITLFAYLFCVFLLMLASFRLVQYFLQLGLRPAEWKAHLQLTFRTQVHTTIIGISIFSFLVIGASTIFFFINRHSRINKERLSRSIAIMKAEVETALSNHALLDDVLKLYDAPSSAELKGKINRISEIHGVDVNIYDPNGNLRISSQPYYYNKGLLSSKTDPLAYYKLSREYLVQTIENEKVGKLSYMSIYVPVRDDDGKTYAYLNIPYFTSQNELKQEISNFLVTLINLNAFIFLIAGLIAFFVTSRITNSFAIISEKMKEIKLGKTNEAIVWNRNDEIGELVQEYNRMVKQLEESANLLARSEREGAWREMARQVAHEIKNPLTPMKLSIQYLQKAVDSNSADTKQISQNVAKTLVEQIDYLSNIASDFSSFANIGNPRMERVNLIASVQSVVELFNMQENAQVAFTTTINEAYLMADKTQLNRLFTNLIRNAIEAAGEEEAVVELHIDLRNDKAVVAVRDNGQGIPAELQQKIFYPNFTTKTSGTGLGLAMCKSIVEQMKGDIWFTTEQYKGSTFFVELPLLMTGE